jgi:hypothetical protein
MKALQINPSNIVKLTYDYPDEISDHIKITFLMTDGSTEVFDCPISIFDNFIVDLNFIRLT